MHIETVKVVCTVTTDNPYGFYIKNKSDLTDEDVLFDEVEKEESSVEPVRKPRGKKAVSESTSDDQQTEKDAGSPEV